MAHIEATIDRKEVTSKEHDCHRMEGDTMHDHAQACMITLLSMHDHTVGLHCMTMPILKNTPVAL